MRLGRAQKEIEPITREEAPSALSGSESLAYETTKPPPQEAVVVERQRPKLVEVTPTQTLSGDPSFAATGIEPLVPYIVGFLVAAFMFVAEPVFMTTFVSVTALIGFGFILFTGAITIPQLLIAATIGIVCGMIAKWANKKSSARWNAERRRALGFDD